MTKRALIINYNNDKEPDALDIGRARSVITPSEFIHFDKMPSGQWQLTFSEAIVKDFSTIKDFTVLREG